ncbi:MAG: glutamate racemase [Lachnospiraceae bacterium]|nr:glutamate racemase [Lachnospiraceae bacterium]MBQ9935434.1 glutamate racemase [Lachnospiraceae bacterium]
MEQAIGVFDSGVGGLTVVREIMRQLPNENVIYFGDTARVPYGSKSKQTVLKYSKQIVRFLRTKNVKAIVFACNTASALALEEMRAEIDIPVIGVVKPGAKMAADMTQTKSVGIIGTEGTIKSGIYTEYIRRLDPAVTVVGKACPLFVPLVEEGLLEDRITDDMVERYLSELKPYNVDALVLGCTHYPLLMNPIKRYMGEGVTLVNPAYETAKGLKEILKTKDMLNGKSDKVSYDFYVSDGVDSFKAFANEVLPVNVDEVKVVDIESY